MNRLNLVFLLLVISPGVYADAEARADVVRDFVNSYNQGDSAAMLDLCTDDVQWLSVDGDQISVEADGRDALGESLQRFFSGSSVPRSDLLEVTVAGTKIVTVEKAYWMTDSGEQSQCSVAVYQLRELKVSHVWYFDSYEC